MKLRLKRAVQDSIRGAHLLLLRRGLPRRIAFFFHALETPQWQELRRAIEYFLEADYTFVGPERFLSDDADQLAFVSFDDNYRCWYEHLIVLQDLAVPATFYVNLLPCRDTCSLDETTAYFDRLRFFGDRSTMSTSEIKEIASAGHTIGNHTYSHFDLAGVDTATAKEDIRRGKESLEDLLGREIADFAYPYGMRRHITRELREYCEALGTRSIATAIHGMHAGCAGRNMIHRTAWRLDQPVSYNVGNLSVDGRLWERVTGRNAVV